MISACLLVFVRTTDTGQRDDDDDDDDACMSCRARCPSFFSGLMAATAVEDGQEEKVSPERDCHTTLMVMNVNGFMVKPTS